MHIEEYLLLTLRGFEKVTVMADLKEIVFEKPYEITSTVRDVCHTEHTATLYLYMFNDYIKISLQVSDSRLLSGYLNQICLEVHLLT